jgi:hypothetical protein
MSSPDNPTDALWVGLLSGDPGPAVAFFDALMASDLAFAAGGLLRDVAERIVDAGEVIEDDRERSSFIDAAQQVLEQCLPDSVAVAALLQEARDGEEE